MNIFRHIICLTIFISMLIWSPYASASTPGNAVMFNGATYYGVVTDSSELNLTNTGTWEFWVKRLAETDETLMSKTSDYLNNGFYISLSSGVVVFTQGNSDNVITTYASTAIPSNVWCHIAVVKNGSNCSIYVNGDDITGTQGTHVSIGSNSAELAIGIHNDSTQILTGIMDEIRMWNIARTPQQIADNMHMRLGGNEIGLVGYWQFDESTGTIAKDSSGNNNDCTLNNSLMRTESNAQIYNPEGPGGVGGINGHSKLCLWLRANSFTGASDGLPVSIWTDISGYNHHFMPNSMPTFVENAQSNQPAILLDGVDDYFAIQNSQILNPASMSVFTVVNPVGYTSENEIFSLWGDYPSYVLGTIDGKGYVYFVTAGGGNSVQNSINLSGWSLLDVSWDNTAWLFENGNMVGSNSDYSGALSQNLTGEIRVGGIEYTTEYFWDGHIAEVIMFSQAVTDPEHFILENYLSAKYAISLTPSTRDIYASTIYTKDMVGIGLESTFIKNTAFSAGLLLMDNGFLNDSGDYVMAGHNSTGNSVAFDNLPTHIQMRWQRIWNIERTEQGAGSSNNLLIGFDFEKSGFEFMAGNPQHYSLLYRSGTTGNFSVVTTETVSKRENTIVFEISSDHLTTGYYTIGCRLQPNTNGPGGVGATDGTSALTLWLKADTITHLSNGASLTEWADTSGHQHIFSAINTTTFQENIQNGHPAIYFDGTDGYLKMPNTQHLNPEEMNVFAVVHYNGSSSEHEIISLWNIDNDLLGSYAIGVIDGKGYATFVSEGGTTSVQHTALIGSDCKMIDVSWSRLTGASYAENGDLVDQNNLFTGPLKRNQSDEIRIGAVDYASPYVWKGHIAEIIMYAVPLNTAQRTIVQNYLSTKYAIALTPTSLDKYSSTNFDRDVIGIGQENNGKKAISSAAGLILMDKLNFLNDPGDYVMAGHAQAENVYTWTYLSGTIERRWSRSWYIDKTEANSSPSDHLTIAFDFSDSGINASAETPQDYTLLYRTNTNDNFSTIQDINVAKVGDQILFQVSDTDLQDGYYTMGKINRTPIISTILDQTMNEDAVLNTVAFTVTDCNDQSLTITYESSNQELINASGITFSGPMVNASGNSYNVTASSVETSVSMTISPVMNQSGAATITIIVMDPYGLMATASCSITVQAINDPPQVSQIISVSSGSGHHLALRADGTVFAWGKNDCGQLGNGNTTEQYTPVPVQGLSHIKAVFAGKDHSMAIRHDGSLWAWGNNEYGKLGDGTTSARSTPVLITGINAVVDVSLGTIHTLALKSDKTAWAWGRNSFGRLGITPGDDQLTPAQVKGAGGSGFLTNVEQLAAGDDHSMALLSNGNVYIWGSNGNGKLGIGVSSGESYPVYMTSLSNIKKIGVGFYHSVALKQDGTVWAWGKKEWLGGGSLSIDQNSPIQVLGENGSGFFQGVVNIAVGEEHNLAILSDGSVWGWGRNGAGRLGDGTTTNRNTPIQVEDSDGTTKLFTILSFDGGTNNSIFAKTDGSIWTCGNNTNGRIGDNTTTERRNITQVHGRRNIDYLMANVVNQNQETKSIHLILADPDANDVTLTALSSDNAILPYTAITLCDSGANTCMLTTTALKSSDIPIEITTTTVSGMITITVNATDSTGLTSSYAFPLRINSAPTIAGLDNLSISTNTTESIALTISDNETSNLVLTKESSDYSLISLENIVISGTGSSRTLTITPTTNQSGTATITISVIDGDTRVIETFEITVNDPPTITAISDIDLAHFIENFSSTNNANLSATTANWSTSDGLLKFYVKQRRYNTFSEHTVGADITSYTDPTSALITADMDGDGDIDLITGSAGHPIRLYLNNGTSAPYSGVTGQNITSDTFMSSDLAVADLNYDGHLDIISGNYGVKNRIYLNNGTINPFDGISGSTVNDYTNNTEAILLADINNDGKLDLIEGNEGQENYVYINNGTADPFNGVTALTITSDTHLTQDIAVGDVNNDGYPDVLAANEGTFNKLYLNNGTDDPFNGVSGKNITSDSHNTESIIFKDMNGDGYLDVVCGNTNQVNTLYLHNHTSDPFNGVTAMTLTSDTNPTKAIAACDIDNDGDFDVIEGNSFQTNYLYLNNGTSEPFSNITRTAFSNDSHDTRELAIADMDNDGDLDIMTGNNNFPGEINRLYLNQSTSNPFDGITGTKITDTQSTFTDLVVRDLNGDSHPDIVVTNRHSPNVIYIHNATSEPFNGVTGTYMTADSYTSTTIALADIDGDDCTDVIVGNKSLPNRYYLNNGTADPFSGITGVNISDETYDTRVIAVADVNGDGSPDVISGNYNEFNRISFNNGSSEPYQYATRVSLTHQQEATRALVIEDIDSDGDLDIIVGNEGQANRLHLNNGTDDPFYGESSLFVSADTDNTTSLAVGDIDNDGDMDVIVGNYNQINKLYLNNARPDPFHGVTAQEIGASAYNTLSIKLVDIDGDGDLDVLEGNASQTNKVYLNNGTSTPFSGVAGINIQEISDNTIALDTGDLDHDGDPDLVIVNENEPNQYLLTANVNTTITKTCYDTVNNVAHSIKVCGTGRNRAAITIEPALTNNTGIDLYFRTEDTKFYKVQQNRIHNFPDIKIGDLSEGLYWSAKLNTLSPAITPEIDYIIITWPTLNITFDISDDMGGLINISCQSSNQTVLSNEGINLAGTFSNVMDITLAANETKSLSLTLIGNPGETGTSTVSVTVTDPQGAINSSSFVATLNDKPIFSVIPDKVIDENSGQFNIPLNITNNFGTLTTVNASSNNQTLIPDGNLSMDSNGNQYTVTVMPNSDQYGHAILTIYTIDSYNDSYHQIINVTVNPVNKLPESSLIGNINVQEDTSVAIPFVITDTDGGTLVVSSSTDNLTLFSNYNVLISDDSSDKNPLIITTSAGNAVALTFSIIPESDQYGTAMISLTVTDSDALAHSQAISVTINSVEDAPVISLYPNIAAGDKHTIALNADGTVWAWGNNDHGQLGDGSLINRSTPVKVSSLTDVVEVATGDSFSVALKDDGSVWAWGWNAYGMVGNDSTDDALMPTQVLGQSGVGYLTNVVSIDCGNHYVLAVKSDGSVWSWGCNASGKLGDGTFNERHTPVQVLGEEGSGYLTGIIMVAAGDSHSLALDGNGNVWAWGTNFLGQLGIGKTNTNETEPVRVENLAHVKAIAAGKEHSIALKNNGTVWAWGVDHNGQLGDGLWDIKYIPARVNNLNNVISISAGGNTSAVLKSDGTAWAFGSNSHGQLGNGSMIDERTPIQLSTATDIRSVAVGNYHILVLRKEGDVWASGRNTSGQLGDGTQTNSNTAVQVVGLYDVGHLNLLMVNKNTHFKGIKYFITDAEGDQITMTGVSYNTTVLPENTMNLADSSSNPYTFIADPGKLYIKFVDLTPGVGNVGSSTFISGLSDSTGLTHFSIIKLSVNDVPQLSDIENQGFKINSSANAIAFTVNDLGTGISELVVIAESSYTELAADTNFMITGTSSNRTFEITPVSNMTGSTLITLTISDGNASFSKSFTLTVKAPPKISHILSQETLENLAISLIFSITDTADGVLTISHTSSNALVVNSESFQMTHPMMKAGGYTLTVNNSIPEMLTLNINPQQNKNGVSEIQINLSDAYGLTATDSFLLTVIKASSRSIELDGNDDYIICQDHFTNPPIDAVTVEAWIYLYTNTLDMTILSFGNTSNESIMFDHGDHNLNLQLRNAANTNFVSLENATASGFSLEQWFHVCATWNNPTAKGKLYKNGLLIFEDTFSADTIGYSGTTELFIGSFLGSSKFFKGKVDDVRFWQTELSEDTIQAWMFKTLTENHPNFDQLVAYYPFHAISGTKIFDIHKKHHGFLDGALRSVYIPFDNWQNTINNNWNDPANWESGSVPIANNPDFTVINPDIRIPVLHEPSFVKNLVLTTGTSYKASETNALTIYGNLYDHIHETLNINNSVTIYSSCDFKTDRISPESSEYTITLTYSGDDAHLTWHKAVDDISVDLEYAVVMSDYSQTCVDSLAHIAENITPCMVEIVIPFQTVAGSGSGEEIRSAGGDSVEVDVLGVGSGNYFNVLVRDEMNNLKGYWGSH
jgi:alpha-tubulin suppressor-like RCC1 family protein